MSNDISPTASTGQAISALAESGAAALQGVTATEDNAYILAAARSRLLEAEVLCSLAAGIPWPFARSLGALSTAVNDVVKHIHAKTQVTFDNDEDVVSFIAEIERREACVECLDEARIAAALMLAHLTKAIQATAERPKLSIVPVSSTPG